MSRNTFRVSTSHIGNRTNFVVFDRMNPYVAYNHNSIDNIILLYIVAFFLNI